MKKLFLLAMTLILGISAIAQQKIQLRSVDKAECVKSDMTSLKASFSFSSIDAQDYESERGTFSWLSLANTVIGGNEGNPQIPVVNELIAVPFGANPSIEITSYSTTDYRLEDYGIHTLVPRQPSLRKDQRPEDVPFIMNETAYQTRGLRSAPQAVVGIEGTMRGIQLGKMTIEPVSYDPVNNTIRVFNDIEVTVHFDGADKQATEQMLVDTYSPYFDIVYKQMFNGRAITSVYDDHPDLYSTPVKMLVVTTSTYANSTAFQNWLTWKKQKGIEVDIYTVTSSTTSSIIRSGIQSRYNTNHPSFLVIVGDETVVPYYSLWNYGSSYGNAATDLEYASVDGDIYHDMYISRMPVNSTTQLGYLVDKILMYEKYTMPNTSYLNETLLIAGWDEPDPGYTSWTPIAGKPTINYATNNYFNSEHGITPHTFITTASGQTTCYNYINNVGFVNYTAHGNIQEWSDPNFTNSNVNSLTNTNKPFWAMGNCCLSASYSNTRYTPCFGETMVRAENKAAFGYIGSVVETYWYEDLSFGVGAFNASYSTTNNPTLSNTKTGAYDAMFDDTGFNTLNSVPYIGNVSVSYVYANNYTHSTGSGSNASEEYYWRCYQCFGDGSVMPYLKVPAANNVSHASALQIGATSFTVNADARSYVAITVNNEIIGVAAVPANATSVDVPITPQTTAGTAMIVVTRNQRQPYITTIPIRSDSEYTITVNSNLSAGGTVTGGGQYYENSECTLTATANHGYAFDNWTLNNTVVSTNPTYTFTVSGNATYTANFHALTLHALTYNPNQSHGTISVTPTSAYAGDVITLTATPEDGYRLDQWDVNTVSKGNVQVVNNQFTMPDSDVTISATFRQGYAVTVANLIGGTITASAGAAQPGETITLTVTPNTGYEFMSWNVYETGNSSNTVTVDERNRFTMPEFDVTVSAVFGTSQQIENVVEIGTGTSTNTNVPTVSSRKYSLTEQIYTAAELGAAGIITGMEIYFASTTARTRNLDIYMVSTSKSSFSSNTDWIKPTASNKVYSGSVAFTASSWKAITFTTPFEYDGRSNVALIVDDNSNSIQTTSFYVFMPSASNQAIYISSGSNQMGSATNYDPTSISSNGTRQNYKNRVNFHINQQQVVPLACEAVPTNVTVSNVTPEGATVSWGGTSDSYNLRYRVSTPKFSYDFEEATPWAVDAFSPCTTYDGDGSATGGISNTSFDNQGYTGSFIAFQNGLSDNLSSHSGNAFGACFYATTPPNNDWFILPSITIENGDVFTFWGRSLSASYLESMRVGVYRGNGAFSSYLAGSASASLTVPVDWTEYSYDLSAYAGQTIQLAINCNSNDKFALFIDDISITNAGGSWDETITDVTSPYTLTGLTDGVTYEVQVIGVCDGIGESEGVGTSFTTLSWCSAPTGLSASNVSTSSADLSWTGFQDSYNVQYRTAGGRETLLYEGFEEELSGWTTSGLGSNTGVNSGFFAFFRNGTTPQYLITPELNITESGCLVAFYHVSYSTTTTIQIGYSSTNNATGSFSWGTSQSIASGSSLDLYYEEIPVGTKYVAIRVNSVGSSSYYYLVDDFMVVGPYIEPGTWHTANNVTSPYSISDLDPDTEYEWQVQGICSNGTTGWSTEAYFMTPSACDAPEGLTTTDITYNSATFNWPQSLENYNLRYGTPETKFSYDFEEATPWAVDAFSPCTTYDGDGSATGGIQDVTFDNQGYTGSFIAFQNDVATGLNAHGGNAFGACMYATTSANNDFFILPSITIETGDVFSFWALGYSSSYPESFKVGVYNGNGGIRSYLAGSASSSITPSTKWTQYSYDLSAYNGQTVQLAIQCVSNDAFIFAIDDIFVGNPHWSEPISVAGGSYAFAIEYGEGYHPATEYAWQVQGVDCDGNGTLTDWSGTATFIMPECFTKHITAFDPETGGYCLISSPIGTVDPTKVINMIDNNTMVEGRYTYDLFRFDQNPSDGKEWRNYRNNDGGHFNLEVGKGYLYGNSSENGVDLIFTGAAITDGTYAVDLAYTSGAEFAGWNLVGNPFAVPATLDQPFYSMVDGAFVSNEANSTLPAMNGAFVVGSNDVTSVTFSRQTGNKAPMLALNLTEAGKLVDRAIVSFGQGRQLPKFQIFTSSKLYIPQDGQGYAVVCSEEMGEAPVNFKAEDNGTYTLNFSMENVEFGYLHLIDNMTGKDIDLLQTPSYSFEAKTTDYESRFKLVFATGNATDNFAYFSNGSFVINNDGAATLQVIDITGRIIKSESINGCANVNVNAAPGIYMLRLINGDNMKVQKVVVK